MCRRADDVFDFDLIAAKSPDFRLLEVGAQLARERGKPLLAIYDDPHGQRDNKGFYPDDRQRQIDVLKQANGVLFMSPLTRDRYVEQGLVRTDKTFILTDSYPLDACFYHPQPAPAKQEDLGKTKYNFVHLGNLPEWRPINPLLDALAWLEGQQNWHPVHISSMDMFILRQLSSSSPMPTLHPASASGQQLATSNPIMSQIRLTSYWS